MGMGMGMDISMGMGMDGDGYGAGGYWGPHSESGKVTGGSGKPARIEVDRRIPSTQVSSLCVEQDILDTRLNVYCSVDEDGKILRYPYPYPSFVTSEVR
ncbi:predicted protein [Sclerotinia sclerotiorum 1980 UF-70]|uniref:Uncharacterized protein n=1 Tax=Sclerotinia sclerotiorum (strain ATCC 18683 / 1980 / Ss-1) TaxID=665079 RepID=A7EF77_SCLS1|nr:predicted protein [Sclerotinia sclerotiorum 1980 UF-70]EDO01493.1 predicted protein [Sclerotinia sclerotiorum 1980 UF-70]